MHNSLHIRELLKRTNSDPMRVKRRNPHRIVAPDPDARPGDGDFTLDGTWCVKHDGTPSSVAAAEDFSEFLGLMGVTCADGGEHVVRLSLADDLPVRACRLSYAPGEVLIEGADNAGLWAGVAWTEREMRVRRGPFLPEGTTVREAAWPVQISQGPWGGNYSVPDFSPEYLADDSFRLYAHYGVNSMMIYGDLLCYVKSDIFPELNCEDYEENIAMLKDAARRAEVYGVQFSYVVVGPKLRASHPVFVNHPNALGSGKTAENPDENIHCLCSSDEEVLAFYTETFENLFREVPRLAGLILIIGGESFYHCHMWGHAVHKCPRCHAQEPEDVVAHLVDVVAKATHAEQPDAFVVAWPYNIDAWEHDDGLQLIKALPKGSGFINQIDRKHRYEKDGYSKFIWDYSIDFIGPSDQITKQAEMVKFRDLPLFLRTETGIGLEVFQYPYVPAMQRLADKWQVVRDLKPQGVHQAWLFFGMFGSRAEELGLWAAYGADMSRDEFLRSMAVRDFGPDAVEAVMKAWQYISNAMGHLPSLLLGNYYIGPGFLGPAHPLVPNRDDEVPEVFSAALFYLQEGEETFSRARNVIKTSLVMTDIPETARDIGVDWDGPGDGWDIVLREYEMAMESTKDAVRLLLKAEKQATNPRDTENLREERLLAELIYRTFLTSMHVVEFYYRRRLFEADGDERHRKRMRRIAQHELDSSRTARHIYDDAPWLDLAERTDGSYSSCSKMLYAKMTLIQEFLMM